MKQTKNIFKVMLIVIISILFIKNYSYGTEDVNGIYLSLRGKSNKKVTGYYSVSTSSGVTPLIDIVKTNSNGTVELESNGSIYCLKNGMGFTTSNSMRNVTHYTQYFDLKNPNSITNPYKTLLPQSDDRYNELMWVLENICIPENEDSKRLLLGAAGINENEFKYYAIENYDEQSIEKDIIEGVQQAAIWYFTNPSGEYHPTENVNFFVTSSGRLQHIENFYTNETGESSSINKLYRYLINGAKNAVQNGYNYSTISNSSPITLDKSNATVIMSESNFIVGPYKVTKNGAGDCTFNVSITDGAQQLEDVTILNENKTQEILGESITKKIISNLGKNFYISLPINTSAKKLNLIVNTGYSATSLTYWTTAANMINNSQPIVIVNKEEKKNIQTDTKQITKPKFDLALRKFVTSVNGEELAESREPTYSQEELRKLATGNSELDNGTTLTKKHTKSAIFVEKGDRVVYTIRIYNEGQVDGKATEITEYLPDGLELIPATESSINANYKWKSENGKVYTNVLSTYQPIKAFDNDPKDGKYTIDYKDIQIECKVTAETNSTDNYLKSVAEITVTSNDENLQDRDSNIASINNEQKINYNPGTSEEGKGYEDDDDFENIVLQGKYFDLALRKFITNVDNKTYNREPVVDVKPLKEGQTTASYAHTKGPVSVEAGNVVTYAIRIYNEGQIDGYADEIIERLPEELEFINDEFNAQYGWIIDNTDETQRTIKTTALSKQNDEDNIIKAFDTNSENLDYKEIKIRCKVSATAPTMKEITSVTEITKNSNSANLSDRDNKTNLSLPSDADLPKYKGDSSNKDDLADSSYYYKGQEDDDDFEKVILEKFDLALRQFISNVNNEQIQERIPQVDFSNFGKIVNGKQITNCEYKQSKEPVKVVKGDVITYTIRVYNEGTQPGYATEIKNYISEGLEFLPDTETNQKYRWKMHDENGNLTTDLSNAKYLTTDYLSKDVESVKNLLGPFDLTYTNEPEYRYVKISFKVCEPKTTERIIENKAEISKDSDINGDEVTDIDSSTDSLNEEEDDWDTEKVYVKYFDLSLKKWVEHTIIIEDGIEKEMETGKSSNKTSLENESDTEEATNNSKQEETIIKVELDKKNFENTVVKFRYNIKVSNEGEISGYVKEISDYIPEGFKFNQADNLYWKETNGKITTDVLKNTLLNPGDTQIVEVTLTWINGENNMGIKRNFAEISKTYNESDTPDIDSTPNNKQEGEDDMDDTAVALAVSAGSAPTYIAIISVILVVLSVGLFIIKKYVL